MIARLVSGACAAGLFLLAGCASGPVYGYYKVASDFVSSAQAQEAPEIIQTPAYSQHAGRATTVAVRAPDSCSNATTNEATGRAAAGGAIIQTSCGVEMAEIERALTRAGYNVISWNILAREMRSDRPAAEVAGALGAQVLFQINSLENSQLRLGQDARWERTYFTTDPQGRTSRPLRLSEEDRALIRQRYLAPIEANNERALAVTLDASAVWVPTGQTIWYYRWTRAREPGALAGGYQVVLACMNYMLSQCETRRPTPLREPGGTTLASGESVGVSASERPEDRARAIYAELFREVVNDFVTSFARARQLS